MSLNFNNFTFLGISNLIGWNVVLTSLDFFSSKFTNYDVNFLMVIPCDIGTLLANFFIGFFIKSISMNKRILTSLITLSLLIILLPLEAFLLPNDTGFWLFMLLNFLIAIFMVFLQGSILGLAGNYPDYCMGYINFGFSISGVLTCFLRMVCLWAWKNDDETNFYSIIIYYASSTIIVALTILIYLRFMVIHNKDYKGYKGIENGSEAKDKGENQRIYRFLLGSIIYTLPFSLLMVIVNLQTFLLFPGVALGTTLFQMGDAWNGVILLLIFNVFDAIGRYCSLYRIFYEKIYLWILVLLRFLFIGTFFILFKNEHDSIINNSYFAIGNMVVFAFSNGYLITALFILPTELYKKQKEKELIGFMMGFMLNLGIIIGSLIALKFANL